MLCGTTRISARPHGIVGHIAPTVFTVKQIMSNEVQFAGPLRQAGKPWSVAEASQFLGISARTLWRMIDTKEVRVARIGRRVLVPDSSVRRLAGEEGK
jgi:excisionase family DNA binding protein